MSDDAPKLRVSRGVILGIISMCLVRASVWFVYLIFCLSVNTTVFHTVLSARLVLNMLILAQDLGSAWE